MHHVDGLEVLSTDSELEFKPTTQHALTFSSSEGEEEQNRVEQYQELERVDEYETEEYASGDNQEQYAEDGECEEWSENEEGVEYEFEDDCDVSSTTTFTYSSRCHWF